MPLHYSPSRTPYSSTDLVLHNAQRQCLWFDNPAAASKEKKWEENLELVCVTPPQPQCYPVVLP